MSKQEVSGSCDWLSNCLFLQRSHTWLKLDMLLNQVVIGFQIVYFYREVTQLIIKAKRGI